MSIYDQIMEEYKKTLMASLEPNILITSRLGYNYIKAKFRPVEEPDLFDIYVEEIRRLDELEGQIQGS